MVTLEKCIELKQLIPIAQLDRSSQITVGTKKKKKKKKKKGRKIPLTTISVSILYKSIAGRYWPVRVADGPITARYSFIKNAIWDIGIFIDITTTIPAT